MTTPTKESTRPAATSGKVQQDNDGAALTSPDYSSALHSTEAELSLLRGLLAARAGRVADLANRLDARDFYMPHHGAIYAAITVAAQRLHDEGHPDAPLQPDLIQQDLQAAGNLSDTVASALLQATSGKYLPPVMADVYRLADGLKRMRLHRALDSAGHELINAASSGTDDDIRRCMNQIAFLPHMAHRAGLEVA
ncbi:DnaB-like helicase N-terminal domain-containing protein [Corynebacterium accolens]|uniref:DnaB-like helicase N-terminal domain-containing protein n=1 Tax=Corynebacterium accolens TaxID=38284 RepID=UPI0025428EF7|nr:DnaB-like helicase N-terminal domain-containing protein [Corynebacterium accolens]MDK4330302.1 DnaB-like helicase N-terminal domain-containing protein [Corynebacterium accolens]